MLFFSFFFVCISIVFRGQQALTRQQHRAHIGVAQKQGDCICTLSWSVHQNFVRDGSYSEREWACTPPLSGWADFSIMMECTPESGQCPSLCVLCGQQVKLAHFWESYFLNLQGRLFVELGCNRKRKSH